jgi:hypothetical protein
MSTTHWFRTVTRATLLSAVAGVATLLIACQGEPVAPTRNAAPTFDFMNNPDNGNIRIVRHGTDIAVSWTDPKTGLRATHTTFPIPFNGSPETDCGPQSALDPVAQQEVGLLVDPVFLSQIRANAKGTVWIIIRDVNQPGDCYGNKLIAEGTGELHYTDNDTWGAGPEGGNTNAFGWMAQGTVTSVDDGSELRYNGALRYTFRFLGGDPSDPANYDLQVRQVFANVH